eukprot:944597_1
MYLQTPPRQIINRSPEGQQFHRDVTTPGGAHLSPAVSRFLSCQHDKKFRPLTRTPGFHTRNRTANEDHVILTPAAHLNPSVDTFRSVTPPHSHTHRNRNSIRTPAIHVFSPIIESNSPQISSCYSPPVPINNLIEITHNDSITQQNNQQLSPQHLTTIQESIHTSQGNASLLQTPSILTSYDSDSDIEEKWVNIPSSSSDTSFLLEPMLKCNSPSIIFKNNKYRLKRYGSTAYAYCKYRSTNKGTIVSCAGKLKFKRDVLTSYIPCDIDHPPTYTIQIAYDLFNSMLMSIAMLSSDINPKKAFTDVSLHNPLRVIAANRTFDAKKRNLYNKQLEESRKSAKDRTILKQILLANKPKTYWGELCDWGLKHTFEDIYRTHLGDYPESIECIHPNIELREDDDRKQANSNCWCFGSV